MLSISPASSWASAWPSACSDATAMRMRRPSCATVRRRAPRAACEPRTRGTAMNARSIELTLALLLAACGGASQTAPVENAGDTVEPEAVPETESAGDETESAVAQQEQAPEIPMSGPASLTIDAKVRGESTAANVRLLDSNGQEAATGNAGEPIKAPAGDYTLEIKIADAKSMFD